MDLNPAIEELMSMEEFVTKALSNEDNSIFFKVDVDEYRI